MAERTTPRISVITCSIRPKGLALVQDSLKRQTFQDFEWLTEISVPERGHDLNAAYNRALRRAKGELIVSVQDYIKLPDDCLQNFWDAYEKEPDTFFTSPVGKTLDWKKVTWDWRIHPEGQMDWQRWEIDLGAAPLSCLKKIGGFDEELDRFWSCDNVSVGKRAQLAGYKFKNLIYNKALVYDHDAVFPHPFRKNFEPSLNNYRMHQFEKGLTINYLD